MALEAFGTWFDRARLFGGGEPVPAGPTADELELAEIESRGRPLCGQHISEIRGTASLNGWREDPPLTFTTERGSWPLRFEIDDAGRVTAVEWAERKPDPQEILAERLTAAWMQKIDLPCYLSVFGPLADVAVEVFDEWLKNPPAELEEFANPGTKVWITQLDIRAESFSGSYLWVHSSRDDARQWIKERALMYVPSDLFAMAVNQDLSTSSEVSSSASAVRDRYDLSWVINRHTVI